MIGRAPLRRILSLARKELRQLSRDHLTMGFVVGLPAAQLLLFGYAINQDVRNVATVVVDQTQSHLSRALVGHLEATQTFEVRAVAASEERARDLLRDGIVKTAVIIPEDFTRAYYRGRGAEISILVNATDPLLARAVRASGEGLMRQMNSQLDLAQTSESGGGPRAPRRRRSLYAEPELVRPSTMRFAVLNLYNPEVRTATFVVPGLLGVILTTTMILLTSLAIVRERERGTFEFLIATPVRRVELMIGKILPYVGIGVVQIALVVALGLLLFRVPIEGSFLALGISSVVFIAANLTLGLVISSATSTQLQATQVSFFFFLPSVLLSGFMFPFETMPTPIRWLGECLPLTHFIRLVRGTLLRGTPLHDQLVDLGAMALFTLAGLVLATRLFRKRLD